jgi:hypothetical protein
VHGLSRAYRHFETGYVPANENDMAYNADLRFCSTVGDIYQLWESIKTKKLVEPRSFEMMTTAEGAAAHMSPQDPQAQYGFAVTINHEDSHRRIGQHGSLLGYSGSLYDFPQDGLTIVVLTNTEGQNAYAITRALARTILGLPQLPVTPAVPARTLADKPVSAAELTQLAGTYVLRLEAVGPGLHDSFAQYRRTYRVFDEDGRLMIQALGEGPQQLLKQDDGTFAFRSKPQSHVSFTMRGGSAASLKMDPSDFGAPLSGDRIGTGDPETFHRQLQ